MLVETNRGVKSISEEQSCSYSLEVPEKEMSYSLIGQSFLEEEPGQRIIKVLFILEHLEEQMEEDRRRQTHLDFLIMATSKVKKLSTRRNYITSEELEV